jgi:hypothetical protein
MRLKRESLTLGRISLNDAHTEWFLCTLPRFRYTAPSSDMEPLCNFCILNMFRDAV